MFYHWCPAIANTYLEGGLVSLGPGTSVHLQVSGFGKFKPASLSLLQVCTPAAPLLLLLTISTPAVAAACHPWPQWGGERLRRVFSPEKKRIRKWSIYESCSE